MLGFTNTKIKRDKLARNIYNDVGLPTVDKFNHIVSTNMISKCPISVIDISNDENICGTSMASLNG